ncbi:putative protein N(5)-glutamine methyltransferase [Herbiconiux liukaitaii]|uniref:putative protein N(5)-glutamine methyltransferase n=1 Tax=Herbiconiux liukaitaii TaxID=3342799 RepID=UPI0035BB6BE2
MSTDADAASRQDPDVDAGADVDVDADAGAGAGADVDVDADAGAGAGADAGAEFEKVVVRLRGAGCVFAEEEARLIVEVVAERAGGIALLDELVAGRVGGAPLEHLLGWAEFDGLRVLVGPGVFVPRTRTRFLVECAMEVVRHDSVVLDLCCGSGAVATAITARLALAEREVARAGEADLAGVGEVWACDVDGAAVEWARRNVGAERVRQGDLFEALPRELVGRLDVVVVNAPYVPSIAIRTMPPEARLHEARVALDGGDDGLDVHRRIAKEAGRWLAPGGHLLIETSESQASATRSIFLSAGLPAEIRRSDELDATVVIAHRDHEEPEKHPGHEEPEKHPGHEEPEKDEEPEKHEGRRHRP